MIPAVILVFNFLFWGPGIAKSIYRGVSVLICDYILHEALICAEEIRLPNNCKKEAEDTLQAILPWKTSVNVYIRMIDRKYNGTMTVVFDQNHIHTRNLTINMDRLL